MAERKESKTYKLTLTMLQQLESYIDTRDETEWYYGNRTQFEKRHAVIKEWIAQEVNKARRDSR